EHHVGRCLAGNQATTVDAPEAPCVLDPSQYPLKPGTCRCDTSVRRRAQRALKIPDLAFERTDPGVSETAFLMFDFPVEFDHLLAGLRRLQLPRFVHSSDQVISRLQGPEQARSRPLDGFSFCLGCDPLPLLLGEAGLD